MAEHRVSNGMQNGSLGAIPSLEDVMALPAVRRQPALPVLANGLDEEAVSSPLPGDPEELAARLKELEAHLAEQQPQLHFALVHAKGKLLVEVSARGSEKVLMRIPPEGVLRIGEDGKVALGRLLDKRS